MSSSIFNFNRHQYSRAFLGAVILLLGYQGLIWSGCIQPSRGINQWEDNQVRAERYIDAVEGEYTTILAGSSMLARIDAAGIAPKTINLSMAGDSAMTGTGLVLRKKQGKTLIVEMSSWIAREADAGQLNSLFAASFMRRIFSMLKCEYRPVSVLINGVRQLRERGRFPKVQEEGKKTPVLRSNDAVVNVALSMAQEPMSKAEMNALQRAAEKLKQTLSVLKKDLQMEIILLKVPMSKDMDDAQKTKEAEQRIKTVFPSGEWDWIPDAPGGDWQCDDGIHLSGESIVKFTAHVREGIIRLRKGN